jgi:hypothetical protein
MKSFFFIFFIFLYNCNKSNPVLSSDNYYIKKVGYKLITIDSLEVSPEQLKNVDSCIFKQLYDSKGSMDQKFYYYSINKIDKNYYSIIIYHIYSDKYSSLILCNFNLSNKLISKIELFRLEGDGELFNNTSSKFLSDTFIKINEVSGFYRFEDTVDIKNIIEQKEYLIKINSKGQVMPHSSSYE